ncbi:hypothetical protein HK405_010711 [Cladochytrium tenue]|nr:hypothetical protein HK405_010711 [Cladochytrium tenue]
MPGMVVANSHIGLTEIDQEPSTQDGVVEPHSALSDLAHAADGLRVGDDFKTLQYAFRHGVLTAISPPQHSGLVAGYSVAFRTGAELYSEAVVKHDVAVHVSIGDDVKDSYAPSITVQIGRLRELLTNATSPSPFARVTSGELPLVVNVDDPNDISKVLSVTSAHPHIRLVLAGATGAWKVAREIAAAGAAVLLQPARCLPTTWTTRACRPPFSSPSAAEILLDAGARPLGVSIAEPNQVRSLRFEAGWLAAEAGKPQHYADDAIGAATWAVADAFGLADTGVGRIKEGTGANLLVLNAAPGLALSLSASLQLIGDGPTVSLHPQQD